MFWTMVWAVMVALIALPVAFLMLTFLLAILEVGITGLVGFFKNRKKF